MCLYVTSRLRLAYNKENPHDMYDEHLNLIQKWYLARTSSTTRTRVMSIRVVLR
jgi:hypothetical protein